MRDDVAHAKRRWRERYGRKLNHDSYYKLVGMIQNHESILLLNVSRTRSIHLVKDMIVVYNKHTHKILTFLPPGCREMQEGMIKK